MRSTFSDLDPNRCRSGFSYSAVGEISHRSEDGEWQELI